jgi:hypothetical protein
MATRHNYNTANKGVSHSQEAVAEAAAAIASRNLLVAQLKTGQHSLSGNELREQIAVRALRVEGRL